MTATLLTAALSLSLLGCSTKPKPAETPPTAAAPTPPAGQAPDAARPSDAPAATDAASPVMTEEAWDAYFAALSPESSPKPPPPQYDQGELGIKNTAGGDCGFPGNLGQVEIWGSGTVTEYYKLDDLNAFEGVDTHYLCQHSNDDVSYGAPSTDACKTDDEACQSWRDYTPGVLLNSDSFPATEPGVAWIFTVEKVGILCPGQTGTPTAATLVGHLYRGFVQLQGSGQIRWADHWFLDDGAQRPSVCGVSTVERFEWKVKKHSDAGTIKAFADLLRKKKADCVAGTDPDYCGACAYVGANPACEEHVLGLSWQKQ